LETVIEVFPLYYFLLPKFIEECNGLLPDERRTFSKMHGALRALHVSLNDENCSQ